MTRSLTHPVLIAGASIGGLTAALTLRADGIDAILLEKDPIPPRLGVGMTLQPPAVRELYELGLGEELAAHAVATTSVAYYTEHGELLYREPRGLYAGHGFPQYEVNRATLLTMLQRAVDERLGPRATRRGTELLGFDTTARGVRVHTGTGDLRAGTLVGADGLHSTVRAQLHPDDGPLRWSGTQMFRGASAHPGFLDELTLAIVKGTGGVDLIIYPIGGGLINWVLMVPIAAPGPLPAGTVFNEPVAPREVLPHVAGWNLGWLEVTDLITGSDFILRYPQVDRDPLSWWGTGRVTLLGDAAHPMYSLGGNGGSQAIVDARVLAEELAADFGSEAREGLRRYEQRRRRVTTDVVYANRAMRATATADPDALADSTTQYRHHTHADDTLTFSATTIGPR